MNAPQNVTAVFSISIWGLICMLFQSSVLGLCSVLKQITGWTGWDAAPSQPNLDKSITPIRRLRCSSSITAPAQSDRLSLPAMLSDAAGGSSATVRTERRPCWNKYITEITFFFDREQHEKYKETLNTTPAFFNLNHQDRQASARMQLCTGFYKLSRQYFLLPRLLTLDKIPSAVQTACDNPETKGCSVFRKTPKLDCPFLSIRWCDQHVALTLNNRHLESIRGSMEESWGTQWVLLIIHTKGMKTQSWHNGW